MKLKYYLRGLGIGILITTIIFIIGIHVNQDQMFSDEEVIRRAKALGMVMDETDGKTINELDKDKKQDTDLYLLYRLFLCCCSITVLSFF